VARKVSQPIRAAMPAAVVRPWTMHQASD
jgi:hypothetical protein